ncbi:DUF3616 domain-containing protein [Ramlibacter tataouinensis]|nr:DUF3616 domain-containing protein [Ramlibacter tataouinensis]
MTPPTALALEFRPDLDDLEPHKELRDGLSAVLQIDRTLWVANDESASVERLTLTGKCGAGAHTQFMLHDYLDLPLPAEGDPPRPPEVDVEGLDHEGGYLWLVGSHSLKRKKPSLDDGAKNAHKQLARLSVDANRYLLARIPVAREGDAPALARKHVHEGRKLTAARLRDATDAGEGNELMQALRKDKHLAAYLPIPGKDNGFDVEGIAVAGPRVFLGLRGPVLRGWAAVLELRVEDDGHGLLRLAPLDKKGHLVRKHFVALGGRGVRDIRLDGEDLLLLCGPTMDLDGTISILRWPGALRLEEPAMVPACALEHVLDIPHGTGCDRAEGICLFVPSDGAPPSLLVVYDAASEARQRGRSVLMADVFGLPPRAAYAAPR